MTPAALADDSSRGRWRRALLIGIVCFLIYNANRRAISAGDAYPARYLPFSIVQHQTIRLDPIADITAQGRGRGAFWIVHLPDRHLVSLYPVTAPLLLSPLYVPAVLHLDRRGWNAARFDHVARVMEKLSASLVAAFSAALMYLLLRRRTTEGNALLLTAAYALGTTTWVISSQASWQHGMAQLLTIGALLFVTSPPSIPRVLGAGLLCGLIAANRPPDFILAAAIGAFAWTWAGRRRIAFIAAAALPGLLVLLYNLSFIGHLLGGYGSAGNVRFFQHDLLAGIAGILVSPTRGLLVFSPFLIFLAFAWRFRARDRDERRLTLAMSIAVLVQIVLYAKADWRGGLSWGPRYMTDLLPLLVWMLVPVVSAIRGVARASFVATVAISIAIQTIGAFCYVAAVDLPIMAADRPGADDMRAAWQWRNGPILRSLERGIAPAELATEVQGNFDAISGDGVAGQPMFAEGWALAGDATPWKLTVIVDGGASKETQTFFDRPDVREALHVSSPAGWRVAIDTNGLAPGEHRLTAFAWISEHGDMHYLGDRTFVVRGTLEESFRNAVSRMREHQRTDGSWLTQHTTATRFENPRPELNTFLNALLIDVLQPVAARSNLEDSVQRARRWLTQQIEADGLVRYHGLPDGADIGTLGCAITPDTDDTALAWRIAPAPDRERLDTALATIARYRTPEGLYRTWLAPREKYQCLDPGSDPNPTDLAIQIHLLLLLADVQPDAARALCTALQPVVDEDRVWIYYRKAPLIAMLRRPDLQRAGCALSLPESRLRSAVDGQELWLTAARSLESKPARRDLEKILLEIAKDDFARLRTNPPLFYHNDETASVPRYYWSEDLGYALWLRLYDLYQSPNTPPARG